MKKKKSNHESDQIAIFHTMHKYIRVSMSTLEFTAMNNMVQHDLRCHI